jgi:hypothetical protein
MRNRSVTLLALLAANDRLGQPEIYRTVLMKQTFLAETIRPLYQQWYRMFSFVRYYHGPYSEDVFQRLDVLIFNGLAEVTTFERLRGRLEARYKITSAGHSILDQIGATEISNLTLDLVWALQTLGIDRAGTISKLVYQEAEFARIFAKHTKDGVRADSKVPLPAVTAASNETFIMLAALQALRERKLEGRPDARTFTLSTREVVRIFLECLATQVPRPRPSEKTA